MLVLNGQIGRIIALYEGERVLGTLVVERNQQEPSRLELKFEFDPAVGITRLTKDESKAVRQQPSPRRDSFLARILRHRRDQRAAQRRHAR
ncbi:MAG: hypothetical protein AAGI54_00610 [Planctomycetota bacterium]